MRKKSFITKPDLEKGVKRINVTLEIPVVESLLSLTEIKGIPSPTTLAALYIRTGIAKDVKQNQKDNILPRQQNLFTKKRRKKQL